LANRTRAPGVSVAKAGDYSEYPGACLDKGHDAELIRGVEPGNDGRSQQCDGLGRDVAGQHRGNILNEFAFCQTCNRKAICQV